MKTFTGKMFFSCCSIALLAVSLAPLLAQSAPPTLLSTSTHGGQRGTTATILVDGTNLDGAREVRFNISGITASVLKNRRLPNNRSLPTDGRVVTRAIIEDGATKNRLTLSVSIDPAVKPDVYGFRILTPLGMTNMLPFAVVAFPEVLERQPNDLRAEKVELPVTVKGEITHSGDLDHFSFEARAGAELVFEVIASPLGSKLNSRLTLFDSEGKVLARNDDLHGQDSVLVHRFEHAGTYSLRIADAQMGNGPTHHYLLNMGEFPYLTGVFPLGVPAGKGTELKVRGANLGETPTIRVMENSARWIRPISVPGAHNELEIAVGNLAEGFEEEPNNSASTAQEISFPLTINGHISGGSAQGPDQDLFRFSARKGQRLVLEVAADRLGSPLDSVIEILSPESRPVPRATLRCLAETEITLNDPNPTRAGIRVLSWNDFAIDDFVIVGREILQVEALPRGPDDDMRFRNFLGRRTTFLDTTAEAHAVGDPVYKVQIAPPGSKFPPNGMPVFHLNHRNDDGGPIYGRDSRLEFVVPENGAYLVRLSDVQGSEGERYAYRLTIREASPDFMLISGAVPAARQLGRSQADGQTFNVPPGGQIPIRVVAHRIDGFDGEIDVVIEGLPTGLSATRGTIASGDASAMLLLRADHDYEGTPFPLVMTGSARTGQGMVIRHLEGERKLWLVVASSAAEVDVTLDRRRVEIIPGREVRVTVKIDRRDGFTARVPVDIRNLPHGVRVLDVGLNGVLVTEEESSRTFTLYAEPWAEPVERPFYAVGRVETNSSIPREHSSDPVTLVVLPQLSSR